jgi:protein-disulfide isomerase
MIAGTGRLILPVSADRDHIRGSLAAPVTLVEYGDYECPHCGATHPIVQEVLQELGDQVCFAYRHFPLTQVHPHAQLAAEAAEAAGAQGKFWSMHNLLLEHQQALQEQFLQVYAAVIGLDLKDFDRDLALHVYAGRVREDFLSGVRSGVNGTPTFFINGVRHDGDYRYETLLSAIAVTALESEA